MPSWYYVPIPTLPEAEPTVVRLVKWLVEDGAEVHVGTRLVIVETQSGRFAIRTNGVGFLREKLFPAGAELPSVTPIAVVEADEENIPYGRQYSIAERLNPLTENITGDSGT